MQPEDLPMKDPGSAAAAGTGAAGFDLKRFLPYRLSVLTNTVSEGLARRYRDLHPLSVTEWRIMAVLGRFPGLVASEVCQRTAMDKVAISRGVRSLMERGLLERRQDRSDRRRRRLYIAPGHGDRVLREVVPVAQHYERQLLESLDADEFEALSAIITKLISQAEKLNHGD